MRAELHTARFFFSAQNITRVFADFGGSFLKKLLLPEEAGGRPTKCADTVNHGTTRAAAT
jgi:hypothetical protein